MENKSGKKPAFRVLMGRAKDDDIARCVQLVLELAYGPKLDLKIWHFHTERELKHLIKKGPFDFICMYVMNVEWAKRSWSGGHSRARDVLVEIHQRYHTTILALSAWENATELFAGTGIDFLQCPFHIADLRKAVDKAILNATRQ